MPLLVGRRGTVPIAIRVDRPGRGRRRPAGQRARRRAAVRDAGGRRRLRDGHDVRRVAADGAFVGGAIAPGLELGLEALAARTAKLPRVELRTPDRAIGRDTVSAMQSGAVLGYQALAAGLLARIRRELADASDVPPRRRPGDPDRRAVGGAVGARDRRASTPSIPT